MSDQQADRLEAIRDWAKALAVTENRGSSTIEWLLRVVEAADRIETAFENDNASALALAILAYREVRRG